MAAQPFLSIIFPAKNEGENVKTTLNSLFSVKTNYPFEVIIVNDGSEDNCCDFLKTYYKKDQVKLIHSEGIGAANARNLGAKNASGEYLIFCDAHLQFENWWIDLLIEPLLTGQSDAVTPAIGSMGNTKFIGYGQTLKPNLRIKWNSKQNGLFETAVLPGGCFIIRREVFEDVGGFETGFKTWGHEDVELSIKLWLFGYHCHVQPEVKIIHLFRKAHPYKVSYDDVYYNLLRMAYSHFNAVRIQKCRKLIVHAKVKAIEAQVLQDGVNEQREAYFQKRKYNDDWYFNKFDIDF
ncbi:glycosyl transferase family 2 [Bacillus methanolicus]|uniref:glycosyltransferase family 2 protein n=1 Tax=Bacillus methanolicus TaxID=1471 RepID=UPI00237FECB0|nr:glycosyltransferase [Bacillus methanolicus]MDE3838791.1 glycosyl transferase family 2 [Bacillus methanolicus]